MFLGAAVFGAASSARPIRCDRAMWELVQHPGVLHVVENEEGLRLLSQKYSVRIGNFMQLVGLQQAPRTERTICGDDWMRLQDVKWLRSDATGEAVPVIGTLTRFLRDVASLRSDMPIKSAGTLGKLLNGTYKSHGQPVLTITKNHWRAVQLSADEARHRPPLCARPRPRSLGTRPAAPRGAPHSRSNIPCSCACAQKQRSKVEGRPHDRGGRAARARAQAQRPRG